MKDTKEVTLADFKNLQYLYAEPTPLTQEALLDLEPLDLVSNGKDTHLLTEVKADSFRLVRLLVVEGSVTMITPTLLKSLMLDGTWSYSKRRKIDALDAVYSEAGWAIYSLVLEDGKLVEGELLFEGGKLYDSLLDMRQQCLEKLQEFTYSDCPKTLSYSGTSPLSSEDMFFILNHHNDRFLSLDGIFRSTDEVKPNMSWVENPELAWSSCDMYEVEQVISYYGLLNSTIVIS